MCYFRILENKVGNSYFSWRKKSTFNFYLGKYINIYRISHCVVVCFSLSMTSSFVLAITPSCRIIPSSKEFAISQEISRNVLNSAEQILFTVKVITTKYSVNDFHCTFCCSIHCKTFAQFRKFEWTSETYW